MRDLVIAPPDGGKGRSFKAICLASIEAGALWRGGDHKLDVSRPVWAMFAGSEDEIRPFLANLMRGNRALVASRQNGYSRRRSNEGAVEFLRSAGYSVLWQRLEEGSVATIYLPDLFNFDPGMVDPFMIRFVLAPPATFLAEQKIDTVSAVRHAAKLGYPLTKEQLAALVPFAMLFCATLDRRTRYPIPMDPRFPLHLLLVCLNEGLASWPPPEQSYQDRGFGQHRDFLFEVEGLAEVGIPHVLVFNAPHDRFKEVLAREVSLFFSSVKGGK
jgi:hypothetical protein